MKRLIWIPVAGFLLIAGAAVAAATPGLVDRAGSLLTNDQEVTPSPSPSDSDGSGSAEERGPVWPTGDRSSLLEEVLADLVGTGVITQEQSDAITQALTERAEEKRAELEAQRQQVQEMWTQIQGFLEDGVITADEIAQLPEDNPFTNLEEILADGQITQEELESVGPFGGFFLDGPRGPFRPGGPMHHGHGWFFDEPDGESDTDTDSDSDSDPDSEASPDSSANS